MILDGTGLVSNPLGNKPQDPALVKGLAIHHTVGTNTVFGEAAERAVISAIDSQHLGNAWGGFGYHYIIFRSGRAYHCGEGQRAHVAKRNHELRGIALHGDFSNAEPSPEQWDGLKEVLLKETTDYFGVEIRGHREWALPSDPTACPGSIVPKDWATFLTPPPVPYVVRTDIHFSDGTVWHVDAVPPPTI